MASNTKLTKFFIFWVMKMFLGINDENFLRKDKIPMTKREIRILTIALANIHDAEIIVDIGAGTGSISIEAANFAPDSNIFAIEKNPNALDILKKNIKKFEIDNITVINDEASKVLNNFSKIDVAIIGGSGGNLTDILSILDKKLIIGGRFVANFISIQNLANCLDWLKNHKNFSYDAIQVQINHFKKILHYDMAQAANPIFILTATKNS